MVKTKKKLIVFCLILVGVIFLFLKIFWNKIVFLYNYWDNPLSVGYSIPYISLSDPKATYIIQKGFDGQYLVEYIIGNGYCRSCDPNTDDTRHVAIGSSKVTLDDFLDKKVIITGHIREKLGKPLCWKSCAPSLGNDDKGNYIVIDIDRLAIVK